MRPLVTRAALYYSRPLLANCGLSRGTLPEVVILSGGREAAEAKNLPLVGKSEILRRSGGFAASAPQNDSNDAEVGNQRTRRTQRVLQPLSFSFESFVSFVVSFRIGP